MSFAVIDSDLSYWQKQNQPLYQDLWWNIPERKTGTLAVIGGSHGTFATPVRIAEFLSQNFPLQNVSTILPDALRPQLPTMANITFVPSTTSGSLDKSAQLTSLCRNADCNLLIGDLSRNSATAIALSEVLTSKFAKPNPNSDSGTLSQSKFETNLCVLARDTVDLLASEANNWLTRENTILVASMAQLQKVFRAVYYPRMIMLSQPLLPVLETLHKFTLSYPISILTFHQEQIIVAHAGNVSTTHIVDTNYTPIGLWSGHLAANIAALNLYNPKQIFAATTSAILYAPQN